LAARLRSAYLERLKLGMALLLIAEFVLTPTITSATMANCSRIQVETLDRGVTVNSYVVKDPEYVAKRRAEIDANGEDGVWTVSAGELGLVGYTVTYSCLP